MVAARQQHGARGRTGRCDAEIRAAHPARSKGIKVWRLDLAAKATDVGVSQIIGDDEEDVGFLRGEPARCHGG